MTCSAASNFRDRQLRKVKVFNSMEEISPEELLDEVSEHIEHFRSIYILGVDNEGELNIFGTGEREDVMHMGYGLQNLIFKLMAGYEGEEHG